MQHNDDINKAVSSALANRTNVLITGDVRGRGVEATIRKAISDAGVNESLVNASNKFDFLNTVLGVPFQTVEGGFARVWGINDSESSVLIVSGLDCADNGTVEFVKELVTNGTVDGVKMRNIASVIVTQHSPKNLADASLWDRFDDVVTI